MKKENRRNRKPTKKEAYVAEAWFIHFFVLEFLVQGSDRVLIRDLYEAYKRWLPQQEHKSYQKTYLSIDSFGRLFPKIFKRKTMYLHGEYGKGIEGIRLVKALEPSADSDIPRKN